MHVHQCAIHAFNSKEHYARLKVVRSVLLHLCSGPEYLKEDFGKSDTVQREFLRAVFRHENGELSEHFQFFLACIGYLTIIL